MFRSTDKLRILALIVSVELNTSGLFSVTGRQAWYKYLYFAELFAGLWYYTVRHGNVMFLFTCFFIIFILCTWGCSVVFDQVHNHIMPAHVFISMIWSQRNTRFIHLFIVCICWHYSACAVLLTWFRNTLILLYFRVMFDRKQKLCVCSIEWH